MRQAEGRKPFVFRRPTTDFKVPRLDTLARGGSQGTVGNRVGTFTHSAQTRGEAREYDWFCEPSATSPESTLCMAVLHRAILDLITPGTPPQHRKSAAEWLAGSFGAEFEREYALSFTRIIETLTPMSPEEFRQTIFKFADDAIAKQEKADPFRFQRR